jgi:hypothetical protein
MDVRHKAGNRLLAYKKPLPGIALCRAMVFFAHHSLGVLEGQRTSTRLQVAGYTKVYRQLAILRCAFTQSGLIRLDGLSDIPFRDGSAHQTELIAPKVVTEWFSSFNGMLGMKTGKWILLIFLTCT